MKTLTQSTLGFTVALDVPSTNEEFDKLSNKKDSACEAGVEKYIFHTWLGNFRRKFRRLHHFNEAAGFFSHLPVCWLHGWFFFRLHNARGANP